MGSFLKHVLLVYRTTALGRDAFYDRSASLFFFFWGFVILGGARHVIFNPKIDLEKKKTAAIPMKHPVWPRYTTRITQKLRGAYFPTILG